MSRPPDDQVLEQTTSIDRVLFEPAYSQLANILKLSMTNGWLRPGDQLPSEAQLVERYDVSSMTVRRAINILMDQGLVTSQQGRGTFVKPVSMGAATFQLGNLQDLFNDPEHTSVHILESRIMNATPRISRKLKIQENQRTIYIRRLICSNGIPAIYQREFLLYDPTRPIVEAELEVTALQQVFSGSSENILKHGEINIEATILNEEESKLLKLNHPMAAFIFEHLFFDFDEKPLSWGWLVGRADLLRFTAKVGLKNQ